MPSAWLLPEHIADVLPSEAKQIEVLRRALIDEAQSYGYELVIPPLVEHLESLLSGTGQALGLQTFKLVDQLSGRSLGLRADTTPQVARIDAHLLNRSGVARLCYCGPVVHTRPAGPWASREPLQFGAEIYGHSGLEADLEALELALDGLRQAGVRDAVIDLGDARIAESLISPLGLSQRERGAVLAALASKDAVELERCITAAGRPSWRESVEGLVRLSRLYGPLTILDEAVAAYAGSPAIERALSEVAWIARHVQQAHPDVRIGVDLSDLGGQDYYSGVRFSIMGASCGQTLAQGGRYDHVGRVFGRERPAVGFSLDLKALAQALSLGAPRADPRPAIRAPWSEDAALRAAIRALRARGETVVCILPGHEHEAQEFACDRELALAAGQWVLRSL